MAIDTASIESLLVSLYVYGDRLSPEIISSHLGVAPTRSHQKGDVKESKGGKLVSVKTGIWELQSQRKSLIISEHIADIFSGLNKEGIYLPSLDGVDEVHLDVYASGMLSGDGYKHLDFELALEDMLLLSSIGASVRFSVAD